MTVVSIDQTLAKAKACLKNGKIEEAEVHYRSILQKFPTNIRASEGLNIALNSPVNGRPSQPSIAQFNALIALLEAKKYEDVVIQAWELIQRFPKAFEIYNVLGAAFNLLKKFEHATGCFEKSVAIKPDYVDGLINLGSSQRDKSRLSAAVELCYRAIKLSPNSASAYYNLAKTQSRMGENDIAISNFERAIKLSPADARMYSSLGVALASKGNMQAAIDSYKTAIRLNPDYAQTYRNYATVTRLSQDDPIIGKIHELIKKPDLDAGSLMHLSFALGKIEDDFGNLESAIQHYIKGNALRKEYLDYKIETDIELFQKIRKFFEVEEKNAQSGLADQSALSGIPLKNQLVFIVGMPRSGTTLSEQIVASHSKVHGAGELEHLAEAMRSSEWETGQDRSQIFAKIRKHYIEKTGNLTKLPILTDKMPYNFRWVGFILKAFPEAKIVYLKRDPAAVCWSNFKLYFPANGLGYAFDRKDVAQFYNLHADLMDFWQKKFPEKIYTLNYEKLTENQEEETRKLFAYLGLDWEDKVLDFHKSERSVRTASNQQVRKKMYKGSSEEWKKYEPWLGEMLEILKPVM
jgi:tetratricopeptide (TPR) repeat protein